MTRSVSPAAQSARCPSARTKVKPLAAPGPDLIGNIGSRLAACDGADAHGSDMKFDGDRV